MDIATKKRFFGLIAEARKNIESAAHEAGLEYPVTIKESIDRMVEDVLYEACIASGHQLKEGVDLGELAEYEPICPACMDNSFSRERRQ